MIQTLAFLSKRFLWRARLTKSTKWFLVISVLSLLLSVFLFSIVDSLVLGLSQAMNQFNARLEAPYSLSVDLDQKSELEPLFQAEQGAQVIFLTEFEGLLSVEEGQYHSVLVKMWQPRLHSSKNNSSIEYFLNEGFDESEISVEETLTASSILIGEELYKRLGLLPGDEAPLKLINPVGDVGPSGEFEPRAQTFQLKGLFSLDRKELEERVVFIRADALHKMGQLDFMSHQFGVLGNERQAIQKFVSDWNQTHPDYLFQHWKEKNPLLSKALQLESLVYRILFMILTLIACFNSISVATLFVHEKAKDVTMLKILGMSAHQCKMVFAFVAGLLGLIGTGLGLILSNTLVLLLKVSHFQLPASYGFTTVPIGFAWKTAFFLIVFVPILNAALGYLLSHSILKLKFKESLLKT